MSTRAVPWRAAFCWPVGLRPRVARKFDIQKSCEPRRGGFVLGLQVLSYRVAKAVVYVRGGTPPEAQYRPNVVHSSPAQPEVLPGFGSQRDIVKTGLMVQCDLLCLFPRVLGDFPYYIHLERGVLTQRVEVPGIPDKSTFVGLYPEREGLCTVEVGLWRPLPSTTALGCLSAPGVLSRYLPTRRVRSGHGSAVR